MKRTGKIITALTLSILLSACQAGRELEQLQRLHERYASDRSGNRGINEEEVLDRGPEKGGTLKLSPQNRTR